MRIDGRRDFVNSLTGLIDLNLAFQRINKALEAKYGLSVIQWSLLQTLIEMPAVSPLVLARALRVTPGTLTQSLNRLEKKEYLFMCDDPSDARKKMISITRKGKNVLESAEGEYQRVFKEIENVRDAIEKVDVFLTRGALGRILE